MGINKTKIKVLEILFDAGHTTDKKITNLSLSQILAMDKLLRPEMIELNNIQEALRANKFIEYLSGVDENKNEGDKTNG